MDCGGHCGVIGQSNWEIGGSVSQHLNATVLVAITTQDQSVCQLLNGLSRVLLKQAVGAEKAGSSLWDIVGRNLESPEHATVVHKCPSHMTNALDRDTLCNPL